MTDKLTFKELMNTDTSTSVPHEVPRCVTLADAAHHLGITRFTLRRWLEADLGLVFPFVGKGSRHLVRVEDIKALITKRLPVKKW